MTMMVDRKGKNAKNKFVDNNLLPEKIMLSATATKDSSNQPTSQPPLREYLAICHLFLSHFVTFLFLDIERLMAIARHEVINNKLKTCHVEWQSM